MPARGTITSLLELWWLTERASQKICNLVYREMPSIEDADLGRGQIALTGGRLGSQERGS
jgi:hypothetical protein